MKSFNNNIINSSKIYSQVYGILDLMDETYINQIPKKVIDFIDDKRDKTYIPKYSLENDFIKQNVSKDALAIVCMIDLNYWCNDKEKTDLTEKLISNQLLHKSQKYNSEILKKEFNKKTEEIIENSSLEMVSYRDNLFIRIIRHFFKNKS